MIARMRHGWHGQLAGRTGNFVAVIAPDNHRLMGAEQGLELLRLFDTSGGLTAPHQG